MSVIKRIDVDAEEAEAIMIAVAVLKDRLYQGKRHYCHGTPDADQAYLSGIRDKYHDIHDSLMTAPADNDNPNRREPQ